MYGSIPEQKRRPGLVWLIGALFLCMVVLLVSWKCHGDQPDPLTTEEREWIHSHPLIRFAPDPSFPPVEYYDKSGRYQGITADYIKLLEKKLGIRFEIVRLKNWDEIITSAKKRQIDMYAASETPQRNVYMNFTRPYAELPVVIIAREKVVEPLTMEKLDGMKVSVVSGYATNDFMFNRHPKLSLDLVPDVQTGLRKASFGLTDAFVENLATASYYIEREGITNLRVAGESGYAYSMAFASRKDWPVLCRVMEKGLALIDPDEKKSIYKKWVFLDPQSQFASGTVRRALLAGFGIIVFAVAGVVLWNRTLTKEVKRRTCQLENELAERRKAENALRESEEKFRVLAETVPAAIIVYQDLKHVYVNPYTTRVSGYTEREFLDSSLLDWAHPDFRDQVRHRALARQRGDDVPSRYEFKTVTKSGEERWVIAAAGRIEYKGEPAGIVTLFDITDRKLMEEELKQARNELEKRVDERTAELAETVEKLLLYRFCIDRAAIGIYQTDTVGDILLVNDFACRLLGYSPDELRSVKVSDIAPAITGEKMSEIESLLETSGSATHETSHRRKDGTVFPVEITTNKLEFRGRSSAISFFKDISGRKRAEEELRESKEKYQAMVDAFDGWVYVCSEDYRIEFMNRKFIDRTGCCETGGYCFEALHHRDSVCPWCANEQVSKGRVARWEYQNPCDNRWYYVVSVPFYRADGSISRQTMITDITERKVHEVKLKKQKRQLEVLNSTLERRVREEAMKNREKDHILIQQNRQAALGETLDHIAHQWKQPINAISLIVHDIGETYLSGELTDQYVYETVERILDLVEHMAQTIAVFRDFYRPEKEKTVFSIKESIDKALIFVGPALRFHSIEVAVSADADLSATGYPKEYAQVLLNILINARDVFNERGTKRPKVEIHAFEEDNKAVVTITDNAGGIPDPIIGKIFEPYFTTKESSGGTGTGLYMSKNIIEQNMGGRLVAGNIDDGAQFRIELAIAGF